MAQDETEFDKLLKEAREWEARDRRRAPSFGMKDDASTFGSSAHAPMVTVEELQKKTAADLAATRGASPRKAQAPMAGTTATTATPRTAQVTWGAFKSAMKEAKAQSQARSQATRAKRKSGWGWIWVLILLYFAFKHFFR